MGTRGRVRARLIIDAALGETARRMGGDVVKRWQASGKTGVRVRYFGVVIQAVDQG